MNPHALRDFWREHERSQFGATLARRRERLAREAASAPSAEEGLEAQRRFASKRGI